MGSVSLIVFVLQASNELKNDNDIQTSIFWDLTLGYLNATMDRKPKMQHWRLEPTGLATPSKTRRLTGMGPYLARQEAAGQVFGPFWTRTDPFFQSKPGRPAGYPDPFLTLSMVMKDHSLMLSCGN